MSEEITNLIIEYSDHYKVSLQDAVMCVICFILED